MQCLRGSFLRPCLIFDANDFVVLIKQAKSDVFISLSFFMLTSLLNSTLNFNKFDYLDIYRTVNYVENVPMDMKKIRLKNLLILIDKYGGQKRLSDITGIDSSYLSQIKNPKNPKNIGEKLARRIEKSCKLENYWMDVDRSIENDNETLEQYTHPKPESNAIWQGGLSLWDDDTPLDDDEVALPFFKEVELSAGNGSTMVQENHGRKLRFSKATLRSCGVTPVHAACVTVSGNSMEPVLPDGSTIGIDTSKTTVQDGKLYAIDHHGELRVKRLYKIPGGKIRLNSYNRDEYPDDVVNADEIRILGKVFWYSVLI